MVGILSYGTSYVSLLGFIVGLFGSAHIKLVSEGRITAAVWLFTQVAEFSYLIYFAATAAMFLVQKYLFHYHFESREVQIVIIISLIASYLGRYEGYGNTVYTANLKQAKANIPSFWQNLIWHIGRVILVYLGFRAVALASFHLVLVICTSLYFVIMLKEFPKGTYDKQLAKEYFRFAVPALIIVIVNSLTGYADKLMLAHFTNTTQLGYYSAAYAIGGMFMLIALPVGNIFFPLFSGMIARGDWKGVNNNSANTEAIILFILPLACALSIAGRGPLFWLWGTL